MGPIIYISLIFKDDKAHIFRTSYRQQYLKALSLRSSSSLDKAPTLTYHLQECLSQVTDTCAALSKMSKFKKLDGEPGTYGA